MQRAPQRLSINYNNLRVIDLTTNQAVGGSLNAALRRSDQREESSFRARQNTKAPLVGAFFFVCVRTEALERVMADWHSGRVEECSGLRLSIVNRYLISSGMLCRIQGRVR